MAVLALGIAATAITTSSSFTAGAVAAAAITAAAAAAGSYIDSQFVFPALFPPPNVTGQRVGELRLQAQEEGAPIPFPIGPENRFAGIVRWASPLIEEETSSGGGGKGGGGGGGAKGYAYYVDIAILVAARQISAIEKIWAEGKLLFDASTGLSINLTSTNLTVTKRGIKMYITSSSFELDIFKDGLDITVAGFANGGNNGTFRVQSVTKDAGSGTSRIQVNNSLAVAETAGASVMLSQTKQPFDTSKVTSVTIYLGSASQDPDPLIESYEGAGNVPAYRGTAYVVLERVFLGDYGNRVPQFNFQVKADDSSTPGSAIATLMGLARRDASTYDVSRLSGELRGYNVTGPNATAKNLQPIKIAHDVIEQERDGKIVFFHRRDATIIDVDPADLAAREDGTDTARPFDVDRIEDAVLPSEANIDYLDPDTDYQSGSQRERRREFSTDNVASYSVPMVLTAARAKAIVARLLWIAWANREVVRLTLPISYAYIAENDVLRFYELGRLWTLLVRRVDRGHNFILNIEAVVEVRDVLTQPEVAEPPYGFEDGPEVFTPPEADFEIIDIPAISSVTAREAGFYAALGLIDPSRQFAGGELFESNDDDDYSPKALFDNESAVGIAASTLGSAIPGYWDLINTVDVELYHGSLESRSEIDVLNGHNRAVLGGEVIGFQNATLVAPRTYRLSKLIRGLRNTEDQVGTHATGDRFVWLNSSGVIWVPINTAAIGTTRFYKGAAAGAELADITPTEHTLLASTLRPFGPTHLAYVREDPDPNDVTLSWVRRTRDVVRIFGTDAAPLLEEIEKYEVDIYYPAGGSTIVRTLTAIGSPTAIYEEADQLTDGLPNGSAIDVVVYQISAVLGRGKASEKLEIPAA